MVKLALLAFVYCLVFCSISSGAVSIVIPKKPILKIKPTGANVGLKMCFDDLNVKFAKTLDFLPSFLNQGQAQIFSVLESCALANERSIVIGQISSWVRLMCFHLFLYKFSAIGLLEKMEAWKTATEQSLFLFLLSEWIKRHSSALSFMLLLYQQALKPAHEIKSAIDRYSDKFKLTLLDKRDLAIQVEGVLHSASHFCQFENLKEKVLACPEANGTKIVFYSGSKSSLFGNFFAPVLAEGYWQSFSTGNSQLIIVVEAKKSLKSLSSSLLNYAFVALLKVKNHFGKKELQIKIFDQNSRQGAFDQKTLTLFVINALLKVFNKSFEQKRVPFKTTAKEILGIFELQSLPVAIESRPETISPEDLNLYFAATKRSLIEKKVVQVPSSTKNLQKAATVALAVTINRFRQRGSPKKPLEIEPSYENSRFPAFAKLSSGGRSPGFIKKVPAKGLKQSFVNKQKDYSAPEESYDSENAVSTFAQATKTLRKNQVLNTRKIISTIINLTSTESAQKALDDLCAKLGIKDSSPEGLEQALGKDLAEKIEDIFDAIEKGVPPKDRLNQDLVETFGVQIKPEQKNSELGVQVVPESKGSAFEQGAIDQKQEPDPGQRSGEAIQEAAVEGRQVEVEKAQPEISQGQSSPKPSIQDSDNQPEIASREQKRLPQTYPEQTSETLVEKPKSTRIGNVLSAGMHAAKGAARVVGVARNAITNPVQAVRDGSRIGGNALTAARSGANKAAMSAFAFVTNVAKKAKEAGQTILSGGG